MPGSLFPMEKGIRSLGAGSFHEPRDPWDIPRAIRFLEGSYGIKTRGKSNKIACFLLLGKQHYIYVPGIEISRVFFEKGFFWFLGSTGRGAHFAWKKNSFFPLKIFAEMGDSFMFLQKYLYSWQEKQGSQR